MTVYVVMTQDQDDADELIGVFWTQAQADRVARLAESHHPFQSVAVFPAPLDQVAPGLVDREEFMAALAEAG